MAINKKKKRDVEHYVDNKALYQAFIDYQAQEPDKDGFRRISNYIGSCIEKICRGLSLAHNFRNYCVDSETEVLTKRGWLGGEELTEEDVVLSLDPNTGHYDWSGLSGLYRGHHSGLMHRLRCRGLDALVTPGHKFLTASGLKPVELLLTSDKIVLNGKHAPDVEASYEDDFVQLVGWAVTEGSYSTYEGKRKTTEYVSISQNRGEKADRIELCLESIGAHYYRRYPEHVKCGKFDLSGEAAEKIKAVAPNRVPSVPFIMSLTQAQRVLLIETMVSGDGSKISDSCWVYSQKDEAHFDAFILLCTLAGMKTDSRPYDNETPFGRTQGFRTYVQTDAKYKHCLGANVDFHGGRGGTCGRGQTKADRPNTPTVFYNGPVWCPTTKYGNFVCRRNGSVYVTGNSYRDEMIDDAVENCIYAVPFFKPEKSQNPFGYFTLVAFRAFIRRIQSEQKQNYIKHKNFQKLYIESGGTLGSMPNEYSNEVVEKYERKMAENKKKSKEAGLLKLAQKEAEE